MNRTMKTPRHAPIMKAPGGMTIISGQAAHSRKRSSGFRALVSTRVSCAAKGAENPTEPAGRTARDFRTFSRKGKEFKEMGSHAQPMRARVKNRSRAASKPAPVREAANSHAPAGNKMPQDRNGDDGNAPTVSHGALWGELRTVAGPRSRIQTTRSLQTTIDELREP